MPVTKQLSDVALSEAEQSALELLRKAPTRANGPVLASFFVTERGDEVRALIDRLAQEGAISFTAMTDVVEPKVTATKDGVASVVPDSFAAVLAIDDMQILGIESAKNLKVNRRSGMGLGE